MKYRFISLFILLMLLVGCNKVPNNTSDDISQKDEINQVTDVSDTGTVEYSTDDSEEDDSAEARIPQFIKVFADKLNVRESYDINSTVIEQLALNSVYKVTRISIDKDNNTWYKIHLKDKFQ